MDPMLATGGSAVYALDRLTADSNAYIRPGRGDAGDRVFGTA